MMRRSQVLLIAGLSGVASLLLVPVEAIALLPGPPTVVRLLSIIQPAILTVIMVFAGDWATRRTGLHAPVVDAWLQRDCVSPIVRRMAVPAILGAMIAGLAVVAFALSYGNAIEHAATARQSTGTAFALPLATKLLYGGISEELITRWGLVSLFCLIGWRITGRPAQLPYAAMIVAVSLAALLFAAGHLPLLFAIVPDASTLFVIAVIAGNALPGLVFGALFIRYGIEAAIIAHMGAYLVSTAILTAI
ncbi:CPBP family intramembrane metalloprotease [Croceicoccus ponticola]|uniref:CPBP family intramembrane metalloprotease n=1 Tax=Croceicoccus ponticola TaxID=2217664 RepID=A0A437GXA7_9SPHN|nr:CPBP family glutamic-type intramembrane protease [Croceicoccus ponticola]RVQ67033.1 CPBP family intramembrane metalloprotease [Croceicoccus ponticola]